MARLVRQGPRFERGDRAGRSRPCARRLPGAALGDPRRREVVPRRRRRPRRRAGARRRPLAARRPPRRRRGDHRPSGRDRSPPRRLPPPTSAPSSPSSRPSPTSSATIARRLREATRVALVWSERRLRPAAATSPRSRSALGLGEGSGAYYLPRTPNGRGVAAAWRAAGDGRGDGAARRGRDRRAHRLGRRGALRPARRSRSPNAPASSSPRACT